MTLSEPFTINDAVFERMMNSWERDIGGTPVETEEYKLYVANYLTTISLTQKIKLIHYHDLINEYGEFITTKKEHDEKTEARFLQGLKQSQIFYFLRGRTSSDRISVKYQDDTDVHVLVLDCDKPETVVQVADAVLILFSTTNRNAPKSSTRQHGGNAIRVTDQRITISVVKGTLLWMALCEKEIPDWLIWYKPLLNAADV
jgi:hypothetical protein